MPASNFNPERFAMLLARFDVGNPSEHEALNAALALRRYAEQGGLRIVDALGRGDVIQALDNSMKPTREEPQELREAFGKITELAEALTREREIAADLRSELARVPVRIARPRRDAPISHGLMAVTISIAVVLLILAVVQS